MHNHDTKKSVIQEIYLIRHGETKFNRIGLIQGSSVDISLNATGKAQSKAFYNTYKTIPFDAVYTSALKRSIESVKQFIDMGIPHHASSDLNEIHWGQQEGKKIIPQKDYYHILCKQWRAGKTDLRIKGGESPAEVATRINQFICSKLRKEKEKKILICMHGRAMRILLCLLLNYPVSKMYIFNHQNLCLYKLRFTGSMFRIDLFNDISHLKDT